MSNYIDNEKFLQAVIEYNKSCAEAEAKGEELPIIPNYIGQAFLDISDGIASKPNFSGYPFIEDMKNDGTENCLTALKNFDPDKSTNPFGYFTRVVWWAFLRRIEKEKKQLYIKFKASQSGLMHGDTFDGDEHMVINLDNDYVNNFIQDYEDKLEKKKNGK